MGWITIVVSVVYLMSHVTITISSSTINEFPATSGLLYHFELFVCRPVDTDEIGHLSRSQTKWPIARVDRYISRCHGTKKKNRMGWIFALVPHHNASSQWRKFVQPVTGHLWTNGYSIYLFCWFFATSWSLFRVFGAGYFVIDFCYGFSGSKLLSSWFFSPCSWDWICWIYTCTYISSPTFFQKYLTCPLVVFIQ